MNDLNNKQKQAVEAAIGPSVVLAGAGSGKTRVLVSKVVNLIINHSVDPKNILMITFTNKAASEMKSRIGAYQLGFVGTFHSFCVRILRIERELAGLTKDFVIYDDNDQQQLMKSLLKRMGIDKKFTASYFLNRISAAKNQLIKPERYLEVFSDNSAAETALVYREYQKQLKKNQAVDFDDLIMDVVDLFQKNQIVLKKYQDKYRYILVDEFQDTNFAQYLLTKLLGREYRNVTIVGDFSQSIYSWRGAEIKNLEKFQNDFTGVKIFQLEENYRSTQNILDFAYRVISKNQTHPILQLYTKNKSGEEVTFYQADSEEEEAIYIVSTIESFKNIYRYQDCTVLYRTNAQSRAIEEVFLHWGVPYVLIGGVRFYERKEIKDILCYLRLLVNPLDEVSLERVKKIGKKRFDDFKRYYDANHDKTGVKPTDNLIEELFQSTGYLKLYDVNDEEDFTRLENIKELKSVAVAFPKLTDFLEQVALVESEYSAGEKDGRSKDGVKLMTLHQAKGLEFPVVFITGLEEGILPHSRSMDDLYSLEEERRLFYVGITRAIRKLYVTYAKRRFIFGRRSDSIKSRFIEE